MSTITSWRSGRRGIGVAVLFVGLLALLVGLQPTTSASADATCDAMPVGLVGAVQSHYGQAVRVDVQDDYAYVVDWRGSLEVFNVVNPCHPTSLGSVQWAANEFQDIKAIGDFAYVANDANGLAKYNITNPAAPTRVSDRRDGTYAVSVDYNEQYLFVSHLYTSYPGLVVYDMATFPAAPVATYSVGSSWPHNWEVDVEGDRLYIFSGHGAPPRFQVLDISALPNPPTLLGNLDLPVTIYGDGYGVKAAGEHVFLASMEVSGQDGGLLVINVANPNAPYVQGTVQIPNAATPFWKRPGLDVLDNMVYVPGTNGLYGFDVSDPSNPSQTEYYPYPPTFGLVGSGDVAIQDDFAYVSLYPPDGNVSLGWGGLAVYKLRETNLAPVANDDDYVVDEDHTLAVAALGVLDNDSDPDSDPLTATLVDDAAHGALALYGDGSFTYTPDANYNGPDSFTYKANDGTEDSNLATVYITIEPVNDTPVVSWSQSPTSPVLIGEMVSAAVTFADPDIGDSHTCAWEWGDGSTVSSGPCTTGNEVAGNHTYMSVGDYVVSMTVSDSADASDKVTAIVDVNYAFAGFFRPVNNPPAVNNVKAGRAVPIKFSLGGEYGFDILAEGYPRSMRIDCVSGTATDDIEVAKPAGGSGLQYFTMIDQYQYVWKTNKDWGSTCRQFQLKLEDGTQHTADFMFK